MKKLKIYFILLCTGVLFCISGCTKKESPKSCDALAADFEAALTAFITNPTRETCEDYVDALEDYINGCALLTPAERAQFQQSIDDADCSQYQ